MNSTTITWSRLESNDQKRVFLLSSPPEAHLSVLSLRRNESSLVGFWVVLIGLNGMIFLGFSWSLKVVV
jgi:hypothetical protein